ncbi:hypothetical protein [Pseudobutyrivibrio sp. YE44]|uniref:hypothetical protein n=1 Tax=Pseudobutyrivibrio sp. YE44 TaxID=1520802 RepID=UPI0015A2CF8C|nr:hypothetical protein [Pseudobutyrivibrio sp. YE44]
MATTDAWQGEDADAAKDLLANEQVPLLDKIIAIQKDAMEFAEHSLRMFEIYFEDNSYDLRINYDSLEKINNDFKELYFETVDIFDSLEEIASRCQQKYSKYGNIRTPDFSGCRNAMIDLCGGEDDEAGYIYNCMQRFIEYDDAVCRELAESGLMERAQELMIELGIQPSQADTLSIFDGMIDKQDLGIVKKHAPKVWLEIFSRGGFRTRHSQGDILFPSFWSYRNGGVGKSRSGFATLRADGTGKSKTKAKGKADTKSKKKENKVDIGNYATGDAKVDAEIQNLFDTYGKDLSGLANTKDYWENASVTTKKAVSRIFEVDIAFIDSHFDEGKCLMQERRVSNILEQFKNANPSSNETIFNSNIIDEVKSYISNNVTKQYMIELGKVKVENCPGYDSKKSSIIVEMIGPAVVFEYKNGKEYKAQDLWMHLTEERTTRYVKSADKNHPEWFAHEYSIFDVINSTKLSKNEKQASLVALYLTAQNSADLCLYEKIFKSNRDYSNVFTVNPENLSYNAKILLGNHLVALANDNYRGSGYKEYLAFVNAALNTNPDYAKGYVEAILLGSVFAANNYIAMAWEIDPNKVEDCDWTPGRLVRSMEIANHNEVLWTKLYRLYHEYNIRSCTVGFDNKDGENFDFYRKDTILLDYYVIPLKNTMYGVYGMVADSHINTEIDLDETNELEAVTEIVESQKKAVKRKALRDYMTSIIDLPVGIVEVYNPAIASVMKLGVDILTYGEGGSKIDSLIALGYAVPGFKNVNEYTSVYFRAIGDFYDRYESGNDYIEALNDIEQAMMFYSVMTYGDHYYLKINDYYRIQAMREWEQSGILFMYSENDYSNISAKFNIERRVGKAIGAISDGNYSIEEKKAALNFFFYGNTNSDNNSMYKSFTDIPVDLLTQCVNAFNDEFIENEDKLSTAFSNAIGNNREGMEVKIPYVQDYLKN